MMARAERQMNEAGETSAMCTRIPKHLLAYPALSSSLSGRRARFHQQPVALPRRYF